MSDNDELDRVLRAARQGFEPQFEDKLRLRRALAQKLAAGAVVVGVSSSVWGALAPKLLWGVVVAGAAGLVWQARDPGRDTAIQSTPTALSTASPVISTRAKAFEPPGEPLRAIEQPSLADRTPRPAEVRPSGSVAPRSSALTEEAAFLLEARSALRRGEPQKALTLLGSYESRFARGLLRQEVYGTRILALCDLGRKDEARLAATRFSKRWPSSPMTARLVTSCVGESFDLPSAP